MTKINFNYCSWLALKFFKNIGPLGLAGLAIIVGCSLFYGLVALPLNVQINKAQQQINHIKPNEMILPDALQTPANDIPQNIAAVKQILPQANSLHNWLGLIDKASLKQGLRLNRGDYKFIQVKQSKVTSSEPISRYEIVLPVMGPYAQIRQFIANVLYSQPALALSSIKLQRENALATNVEARLVFVLFLQGDSL